jgi:hypothetical protein
VSSQIAFRKPLGEWPEATLTRNAHNANVMPISGREFSSAERRRHGRVPRETCYMHTSCCRSYSAPGNQSFLELAIEKHRKHIARIPTRFDANIGRHLAPRSILAMPVEKTMT